MRTFDEFEKEIKRRQRKEKMKYVYEKAKEWFVQNKEVILTVAPIAIGGAATIAKVVGKRVNLRKQEEVKNLYCYDRSLGHYWALKRNLSNREWLSIDQRKKNGERLADILEELRVLK